MRKIALYIFLSISFLIASMTIIYLIKTDIQNRRKLVAYKTLTISNNINSKAKVDAIVKGYIYISLTDSSRYIIGPTRIITSNRKIFDSFSSNDSLIKLAGSDTLVVISKFGKTEKFLLLY